MPTQASLDVVNKMGYSGADVERFLGINTSAVNLLNDPTKAWGYMNPAKVHYAHERTRESLLYFSRFVVLTMGATSQ